MLVENLFFENQKIKKKSFSKCENPFKKLFSMSFVVQVRQQEYKGSKRKLSFYYFAIFRLI